MKQIYPYLPHGGKASLFQKIKKVATQTGLLKVAFTLVFSCLYLLATHSYSQVSGSWQGVGNTGFSKAMAQHISLALAANGTPYVAYKDYGTSYKATVMRLNGTAWETVGNAGFSAAAVSHTSLALAPDGTPYVAFRDEANGGKVTVMRFDGTNWDVLGDAGFSVGEQDFPSLAIDANGTPYVAYTDRANGYKATVMKYNGNSWVNVGDAGFSADGAYNISLALNANGTPYVAYRDQSINHRAKVMKFNGTVWEPVGTTTLFASGILNVALTLDANDAPYVAFQSSFSDGKKAVVLKFNGASWETVGASGFSVGEISNIAIKTDYSGTPFVFYRDVANDYKATVVKYNGTAWETVGTAGFSAGEIGYPNLALDTNGVPVVAFMDDAIGNKATVMKFTSGPISSTPLAITTQPTAKTIKGGESTGFTVTATGEGQLTYQWQVSNDGGATFSNLTDNTTYQGVNSDQLSITNASLSLNGYLYRVLITNNSTATSDAVKLTVTGPVFDNNRTWQIVGVPGFSVDEIERPSISLDAAGVPYVAFIDVSKDNKLTVMKFVGGSWELVGMEGFSTGSAVSPAIAFAADGTPYVGFKDIAYNGKTTVMKYDGNNWVTVGSPGIGGETYSYFDFALAADGTPYVSFPVSGKATVMKYNGTEWVVVGSPGFTDGSPNALALDSRGTPYVCTIASGGIASAMKYDGTNWVLIGSQGFAEGAYTSYDLVLDANDIPYFSYIDSNNDQKTTVMKFNGTDWELVGNAGFSLNQGVHTSSLVLSADGTPVLAYGSNGGLAVMKYTGTAWELVGSYVTYSPGSYPDLVLDSNGTPYVVYKDGGNAWKITVVTYAVRPNAAPTNIFISASSVAENTAVSTTVGSFTTKDVDAGQSHTYTLVSGTGATDNGSFSIDGNTLKIAVSPDYETKSSYSIRVKTDDGEGGTFEKVFEIKVTDVNEIPTGIVLSKNEIEENNPVGAIIGYLSSIDQDAFDNYVYTLVPGEGDTDNASFTISSGAALEATEWFDYEVKRSYSVRVKTEDSQGGTFESSFAIAVVNVNEAPTAFALSKSDINENNQVGAEVGTLSSTDPDANDSHTYALVSGDGATDNAAFSIQGNVLKATVSFDYETKSSYSIRVRTSDVGGLAFESVKVISINDVQEVVTSLAEGEYEALQVYPNPASHTIMISTDYVIDNVSLVNAYGSTVLVKKGGTKQVQLNVDSVSPGVYTAIINSNGKTYIRRIVVTK